MKRGHGEGSVRLRADGRWEARVSLPDGKRKSIFGKTRAEALNKARAVLRDLEKGVSPADGRLTVEVYLKRWLEAAKPTLDYKSYIHYESEVRLHIVPFIGNTPLVKLTPFQLNEMYAVLSEKGFSSTTVRYAHRTVKQALEQAVKLDILARNVAQLASPPRAEKHEMIFLSREEAKRLLDAAKGTRLEAMWVLALSTGMRLGELLALQWSGVNFKQGLVSITKTLQRRPTRHGGLTPKKAKTVSSRRTIPITPEAVVALKQHKSRQAQERLKAGPIWVDNDAVFCTQAGGYLRDSHMREDAFLPLLKNAGLPHMRIHDLRHTAATLLLEAGVSPLAVSKMLGHATVAMTMDLYGHVTASMEDAITKSMSRILFG